MKFIHRIAHLLVPRESNNQKARLLHSSSLTLIAFAFVFYQLLISLVPALGSKILGFAANIAPAEVIRLTNEKRVQAGLLPLTENGALSQAAQAKGVDMLNKGYWAHVAPDGTQPWVFFTNFGYKYHYAGENLARDFSNPSAAVDAWMNSSSHKENLLSSKYKEIGIGVVEGSLAGIDTTIIVQFFGTKYADTVAAPIAQVQAQEESAPTAVPVVTGSALVSPFKITRSVALGLVGLLLTILLVDFLFVSRRRIVRVGGRTFAHLAFLGMILAIVLILKAGQII